LSHSGLLCHSNLVYAIYPNKCAPRAAGQSASGAVFGLDAAARMLREIVISFDAGCCCNATSHLPHLSVYVIWNLFFCFDY
jgi:hypothetical protein